MYSSYRARTAARYLPRRLDLAVKPLVSYDEQTGHLFPLPNSRISAQLCDLNFVPSQHSFRSFAVAAAAWAPADRRSRRAVQIGAAVQFRRSLI